VNSNKIRYEMNNDAIATVSMNPYLRSKTLMEKE